MRFFKTTPGFYAKYIFLIDILFISRDNKMLKRKIYNQLLKWKEDRRNGLKNA